jgi:hypothetical protein
MATPTFRLAVAISAKRKTHLSARLSNYSTQYPNACRSYRQSVQPVEGFDEAGVWDSEREADVAFAGGAVAGAEGKDHRRKAPGD